MTREDSALPALRLLYNNEKSAWVHPLFAPRFERLRFSRAGTPTSGDVMPSLLDAADAFSQLGKKFVSINEAACVRVRHRNATCHACQQVCAHDAITIERNVLSLDHHLCTGCGACTSVCPTEALLLFEDVNEYLRDLIDRSEADCVIEVRCERAPKLPLTESEDVVEPEQPGEDQLAARDKVASVRCLASIDETTLIHAACGDVALHYASADCAQCPQQCGTLIEDIIEQARRFLASYSAYDRAQLATQLERFHWTLYGEPGTEQHRDTSPEMSRRGMFDHLIARTTDSVAEAAVGTFYASQHSAEEKPTLAQSLMEAHGILKAAPVERGARLLDDLYRTDPDQADDPTFADDETLLPTRLFGEIELDDDRCDLCGICMTFCPTRALTGVPNKPANPFVAATREVEISGELRFRANDCVACHLCVDICPRQALAMHLGIDRCDLFALEPRLLFKK